MKTPEPAKSGPAQAVCPVCGSDNISTPRLSPWPLFLLGIPLPVRGRKRHCFDCGADFRQPCSRH